MNTFKHGEYLAFVPGKTYEVYKNGKSRGVYKLSHISRCGGVICQDCTCNGRILAFPEFGTCCMSDPTDVSDTWIYKEVRIKSKH